MKTEKYIGNWLLVPELCIYQTGEPPVSGLYSIRIEDGDISFEIEWQDSAGIDNSISFGGPLNGQKHNSDSPGVSDVMYESVNDLTLDSYAYNEDKVVMYARRVASESGDILAVSQIFYGANGSSSNFQVYRRIVTKNSE